MAELNARRRSWPFLRALGGVTLALFAFCHASHPVAAAVFEGVTVPETYAVDGRMLQLNGFGLRTLTIFRVRIYVAALYLEHPSHDANEILSSPDTKVITLHFIHSGTKAQVEKQYREGEANNCGDGGCDPADRPDFERLVAAAPAVEPGDVSTYIFTNRGVRVYANTKLIGDFSGPDLAHHLLLGFIGNHPPSASLRDHMLGISTD